MIEGWTDNFSKFRQKVEPLFGKLEILAEKYPDSYCHLVLSHGFMEYAGIRDLYGECKDRVKEIYGSFDSHNKQHYSLYNYCLKTEYMGWARQNNLKEELLEQGWETFLDD